MTANASDSRIRRPRVTPDREEEMLHAALQVLREVGYEQLSMDVVAARVRCSKATLYRQWQSKASMVVAALRTIRPVRVEEVDTGSLRSDLLAMAEQLAASAEKDTALHAGLGHAILTDPSLGEAFRTALVEHEVAQLVRVVDRAVERGELPGRPAAVDFLAQLFMGAALTRPAAEGRFADIEYLTRFTDTVVMPALLNS